MFGKGRPLGERGIVSVSTITLLALLAVTGISLLSMQQASLMDSANIQAGGQARFFAQSGLQEAKYYVSHINPTFAGSSPEQLVTNGSGRTIGSYEYSVAISGSNYTVTATGYVPNKTASRKVSHTLTSTFARDYMAVGLLVLDPSASGALNLTGNGSLTVYGGKVVVNSTSATAGVATGNAVLTAPEFLFGGSFSATNNTNFTGTKKINQSPTPDPLAYLSFPTTAGLTVRSASQLTINGAQVLEPGVYTGGLRLQSNANVTMNPGLYYLNGGGFSMAGNAILTGNNVTIYNHPSSASDTFVMSGNGNLTLTAPTTGDYAGIVLMQDRTATAEASFSGNALMRIRGILYFAGATLNLSGNGTVPNVGTLDICNRLNISGNGQLSINNY